MLPFSTLFGLKKASIMKQVEEEADHFLTAQKRRVWICELGIIATLGLVLTVGVLTTIYSQQAFAVTAARQNGGTGGNGGNVGIGQNGGSGTSGTSSNGDACGKQR